MKYKIKEELSEEDKIYLRKRTRLFREVSKGYLLCESYNDKLMMAGIYKKLTGVCKRKQLNCGYCVLSFYKEIVSIVESNNLLAEEPAEEPTTPEPEEQQPEQPKNKTKLKKNGRRKGEKEV